jgi:hypothetical protein
MLQNSVGFVEGESGSCIETCDVDGTEEVGIKVEDNVDIKEGLSFKVEEAVDIKDEIPKAISFPPIKTEQEVRLWRVCEVMAAHAFRPTIALQKGKCEITLDYFLLCVILCVPYTF